MVFDAIQQSSSKSCSNIEAQITAHTSMNSTLKSAIAVLIASVSGMLWAFPYRQNHPLAAVGAFFGQTDTTYALAGWVAGLGVLAFFIGVGLLIAGLVKSSSTTQAEFIYESGGEDISPQSASFDRVKWNALRQYDDEIAAADKKIRPLGLKWSEELASSYLALNDKTYLPQLIDQITARAKSELEEREKLRLESERERLSQIRREQQRSSARKVVEMPEKMNVNWIGLWTIMRRETARILRVPIQAFVAPWISALLFIFIFGFVVGGRIKTIGGHSYLEFVLPGILMMNIVNAAFLQASSAIYFQRFLRFIEETLVAPLSYWEMIVGQLACVILRSVLTAFGILLIAAVFGVTSIDNIWAFLFWVVSVSIIFGLLGIIIGLWARNFEQLTILNVFFIAPLSMVGGVFNTVGMLPGWLRWLAYGNPFFYFINGLRHAMIGFHEAPAAIGLIITFVLIVTMGAAVLRLYAIGFGLRE
jgi:ABC-2 type transport system permease protein